ncbi:MAG: DUF1549 domain-containing protein [Planctomycetales bacterium]
MSSRRISGAVVVVFGIAILGLGWSWGADKGGDRPGGSTASDDAANQPTQAKKRKGKKGKPRKKQNAALASKVSDSAEKPKPRSQTHTAQAQSSQTPSSATRPESARSGESPLAVAARVDAIIQAELARSDASAAPRCSDADFLRRVSLDLAGISPSPQEVTLFGLDPDPDKRQKVIDRLLQSPDYATNWGRYWRDVIFSRATETRVRLALKPFETWMTGQLQANTSWHEIVTSLLTATGDVTEDGRTALIFAQRAEPDEVAAETSRIFLGIQIQCANCHDHPTDSWKRDQFHGLAAFFPRMELRPKRDSMMRSFELVSLSGNGRGGPQAFLENLKENPERFIRRLDKNRDGALQRDEAPGDRKRFQLLFDQGDSNKDGQLSVAELRNMPPPPMNGRRGSDEYYMPDLNDPQSRGTKFDPEFFLGGLKPGAGLSDAERRQAIAGYFTSPDNPWFAKALVNRLWGQLVGEGFYMPIDDIGPDRTPSHPQALEELSQGLIASGYDLHWLFRAIANTQAYQRQLQTRDPQHAVPPFASAAPVRLRADQLYDALTRVLGVDELGGRGPRQRTPGAPRPGDNSPRGTFNQVFGFDPSTPPDEITGTLPQALLLMNSPLINNLIRGAGGTQLAEILDKFPDNQDALQELYLLVHARQPTARELEICRGYLQTVPQRREAFEDILWSLLNSTEFQTKR